MTISDSARTRMHTVHRDLGIEPIDWRSDEDIDLEAIRRKMRSNVWMIVCAVAVVYVWAITMLAITGVWFEWHAALVAFALGFYAYVGCAVKNSSQG